MPTGHQGPALDEAAKGTGTPPGSRGSGPQPTTCFPGLQKWVSFLSICLCFVLLRNLPFPPRCTHLGYVVGFGVKHWG